MKKFPAFLTLLAVSLAFVLGAGTSVYAKEQQDFNSLLEFWQNPENKKASENTAPANEPAKSAEATQPITPAPEVPKPAVAVSSEIKATETEAAKTQSNPADLTAPEPQTLPPSAPPEVQPVTPEREAAGEPGAGESAGIKAPEAPALVAPAPEAKPEEAVPAPAVAMEQKVEMTKTVPQQKKTDGEVVLLDDFNSGVRSNLLGGAMGNWTKDEYDDTQGCDIDFVERPRLGKSGYSMQISYDVDSPKQAYNGVWIKLEDFDARPYKFLVMYFKAPNYPPYGTDNLKLELKNQKNESGVYRITKIPRGAWREYKVPLKKFKGLKDLSALTEMIIVFEDKTTNPKEGIVFLDQVYFTKGEIRRPS